MNSIVIQLIHCTNTELVLAVFSEKFKNVAGHVNTMFDDLILFEYTKEVVSCISETKDFL